MDLFDLLIGFFIVAGIASWAWILFETFIRN